MRRAMAGRAQEDLVVRIRVDDARAGSKFKGLERNMNKFSGMNKKVQTGVKRTRDEFGKFSKKAGGAAKSSGLFGGALGGIGKKALALLGPMASITGAFFLLKSAFSAVMDAGRFAEDTITTLGVALGSERAGVEAFKKSLDFSIITPFDPRAIAQATEFAVAFGIKDPFQKGVDGLAEDVSLQQLAAGIASFSQDKDIVNAMKGILVPEKEVIKRWGGEVLGVYNQIIKGGIALDTPAFQKAWLEGLSRIDKFKKAAGAASQTVTGLMSTIGGNIGNIALFFTGAGEGRDARSFWNFLRGALGQVNDVFGKFMKVAGPFLIEIGAQIGGLFKDIFDIVVDLGKVALPFIVQALTPFLITVTAAFFVLRGIVKVFKFILSLTIRMIVATARWATAGKEMKETFKGAGDFFGDIVLKAKGLLVIFNVILFRFQRSIDNFIKAIEVSGPFKAIGDVLSKFARFSKKSLIAGVKFIIGRDDEDEAEKPVKRKSLGETLTDIGRESEKKKLLSAPRPSVVVPAATGQGKTGGGTVITNIAIETTPENEKPLLNSVRPISGTATVERETRF